MTEAEKPLKGAGTLIRSWIHMIQLRDDGHAQKEAQLIAKEMKHGKTPARYAYWCGLWEGYQEAKKIYEEYYGSITEG